MDELDFTIEFNSDLNDNEFERALLAEAESKLLELAGDHSDITGAAVTLRQPAKKETAPLHEATVVAYVRPNNIVGKEKDESAIGALKGALEAVERQVRRKRKKLRDTWEQPQNDPVTKEVMEVLAAEEADEELDEMLDEELGNESNE